MPINARTYKAHVQLQTGLYACTYRPMQAYQLKEKTAPCKCSCMWALFKLLEKNFKNFYKKRIFEKDTLKFLKNRTYSI